MTRNDFKCVPAAVTQDTGDRGEGIGEAQGDSGLGTGG